MSQNRLQITVCNPWIFLQWIPKLAEELNLQLLQNFRVAEDLEIFASKAKVIDPASFVKDNFEPNFDISSLKEIDEKIQKKSFPII